MKHNSFLDSVSLRVSSGNGGAGSVHFHRDKFNSKGGPDGGDGGNGGNVIFRGNSNMSTLFHLKYIKHIKAEHGGFGSNQLKHGKDGKDTIIEVPIGTHIYSDNKIICEIINDKTNHIIAKGGIGGRGNNFFKTATKRTPRYAQDGKPGTELNIFLELKLLADVGMVGFPNAGKSTLLSVLSNAKPKIGDYPFTTLVPKLGIVSIQKKESFVIADTPGIIQGASNGKGLGLEFLKHFQKNKILLFIIAANTNVIQQYNTLLNELAIFNKDLLLKPKILAISKADLASTEELEKINNLLPKTLVCINFSATTNSNIEKLKYCIWQHIKHQR